MKARLKKVGVNPNEITLRPDTLTLPTFEDEPEVEKDNWESLFFESVTRPDEVDQYGHLPNNYVENSPYYITAGNGYPYYFDTKHMGPLLII